MSWPLGEMRELVSRVLSEQRLAHTLGVADLAEQLAQRHGLDCEKAKFAGLAHDLAKELPVDVQINLSEKWGLIGCPEDKENLQVLHGPIAAYWLEHEWGINDEDVLNAIAHHTLGASNMSSLEMLIFSADLTEPNRTFTGVDNLRQALYDNLERGTLACAKHTLDYLIERKQSIHPQTIATYEDLKRRFNIGT